MFGRAEIVFGYDDQVAHPHIAELAVELYNQNFEPDLTAEEIGWIKQGAREEDTPMRWFNHFYDPVYGNGFNDLAGLNSTPISFTSAKDWAVQPLKQMDFALGDRSWSRGIYDFSMDNRQMAFVELGHIVHLISDMAVPAHTRNSEHVGDPFEAFVKDNWPSIAKQLNYNFVAVDNLDNAFFALAKYSNNNFYSEKTIESGKYSIINVVERVIGEVGGQKVIFAIGNDDNFKKIKLFYSYGDYDWRSTIQIKSLKSSVILNSYATHLLPKAIGYSAGVIKLFVDEGNKKIAEDASRSFWQKIASSDVPLNRISKTGVFNQIFGFAVSGAERVLNYFSAAPKTEPSLAQEETLNHENIKTQEQENVKIPEQELPILAVVPDLPSQPAVVETPAVVEQPIKPVLPVSIPKSPSLPSAEPIAPVVQNNPLVNVCMGCTGFMTPEEIASAQKVVEPEAATTTPEIEPVSTSTEEIATTTPATEIPTTTPDIVTSTPEIEETTTTPVLETTTTTPEIPEMITMSPPQLDISFTTTTYTTSSVVTIFGECATDTVSIQVYRLDALMAPSSTPELMAWATPVINLSAWQVELQINPGESVFYFVAVGAATSSVFSEPARFVKIEEPALMVIEEPLPDYIFTTFDESTSTSTALSPPGQGSAIFQVVKAPITGKVYSLSTKIKKFPGENRNHPEYYDSSWGVMIFNVSSNAGLECGHANNTIATPANAVGAPASLTEVNFTFTTTTIQKDSFYCFMIYRSYGKNQAWITILDKPPADTYPDGNALLNNATIPADIWMKIPIKPTEEIIN